MMAGSYNSPFVALAAPNYRNRDLYGVAVVERMHRFPQAGGRYLDCDPRFCREHWREANWPAGGAA